MKTMTKKLRLGRETVRTLSATQLGLAAGGTSYNPPNPSIGPYCSLACSANCDSSSI